ncbi:MAG: hypothetical protein WD850_02285 [Candidatus Spechtbacterales bacterium]
MENVPPTRPLSPTPDGQQSFIQKNAPRLLIGSGVVILALLALMALMAFGKDDGKLFSLGEKQEQEEEMTETEEGQEEGHRAGVDHRILSSKTVNWGGGGTLELVLANAKTESVPLSCATPNSEEVDNAGIEHSGDAYLRFGGDRLWLGHMRFIEDMLHDGRLVSLQLDPNSDRDFILLYEYGSCSGEFLRVFGYDPKTSTVAQYSFENLTTIFSSSNSFDVQAHGLKVRAYSNATASSAETTWVIEDDRPNMRGIDSSTCSGFCSEGQLGE